MRSCPENRSLHSGLSGQAPEGVSGSESPLQSGASTSSTHGADEMFPVRMDSPEHRSAGVPRPSRGGHNRNGVSGAEVPAEQSSARESSVTESVVKGDVPDVGMSVAPRTPPALAEHRSAGSDPREAQFWFAKSGLVKAPSRLGIGPCRT